MKTRTIKNVVYLSVAVVIAFSAFWGCAAPRYELVQQPQPQRAQSLVPGIYTLQADATMFEDADVGSRRLDKIESGAMVEVVGSSGDFAQIRLSDIAGWVRREEVEDATLSGVVKTIGRVRIREIPSETSPDMEILESGRLVSVKKTQGGWVLVKIAEKRGWILADVLESLGATTSQARLESAKYWKVVKKANLRVSPAIVSEILRVMPAGSSVKYLGSDGEWIKIEYDGSVGYIHNELVEPY